MKKLRECMQRLVKINKQITKEEKVIRDETKAIEKYKAESNEKWGETSAYKEYAEKTRNYSGQKWNDLSDGMDLIMAEFADFMKKGRTPDSIEAQKLVKKLQDYITDNYYLCTKEILAGLGEMYVADERFKNNIDKHSDGTAEFIREAIRVYQA